MDVVSEAESVAHGLAKEVVVHTERGLEGCRELRLDNPFRRREGAGHSDRPLRSEEEGLLTISAVWLKIVAPANTLRSHREQLALRGK